MFDIGFWEILLISVLALIVVGPERLPKAARTAGYWFGRARRYIEGVKEEVASEFDVNELKRMVHNQEVMINDLKSKLNEDVTIDDLGREDVKDGGSRTPTTDEDDSPDYEMLEEEMFEEAEARSRAAKQDADEGDEEGEDNDEFATAAATDPVKAARTPENNGDDEHRVETGKGSRGD